MTSDTKEHAAWALGKIADGNEDNQDAVREAGAIPLIVKLLADEHEKFIDGAVLALVSLCENCPENVEIVRREGGLPLLEELATTGSSSDIRDRAKEALTHCSCDAIDRASSSNTSNHHDDDTGSYTTDCVDSGVLGSTRSSSCESSGSPHECSNRSKDGSDDNATHEDYNNDHNITPTATSSDHTTLSAPISDDYGEIITSN